MLMDGVKSAPKPTFAMLMERIAADSELSALRKKSLLSSIRCYAKLLGQDPARMLVDPAAYTNAIAKFRPARHRLTKSRLANICSDIRCVLRWAGITGVPGRNLTP